MAADRSGVAAPVASPVEDDLPIPSDMNTVFLGGLFILAVLAAYYVAAEIILHDRRGAARERVRAAYSDTEREAEEPVGEPKLFS